MKRILLQCFETGRYLDAVGNWTDSPELAQDFPNSLKATEFKLRRRLSQVFVVVVPASPDHAEPAWACHRVAPARRPDRCMPASDVASKSGARAAKRTFL